MVFGRVLEGMDVVTAIEQAETLPGDNKPVLPVIIADCGELPSDAVPAAEAGSASAAPVAMEQSA